MKRLYLTVLALLCTIASFAVVAPITGASQVCVSSTTTLGCTTPGGTWTSSNPAIATVGGGTGVVSGVAAGNVTITYTVGPEFSIKAMTVNALPTIYNVTGGGNCMPGSHVYLSGSQTGVNYQLYKSGVPSGSPVAGTGSSIDFGLKTLAGSYTVIATNATTSCVSNMAGSATVALIFPAPNSYTLYLGGSGGICAGGPGVHIFLGGSQTPGFTYALVNGIISYGAMPGTGGILDFGAHNDPGDYYVIATNTATGCTTTIGPITIYNLPTPGIISGPSSVCVGGTSTMADTPSGGTWTSSNTAVATIGSSSGVVTGVTIGSTVITYALTSGCISTTTVNAINLVPAISGASTVCVGASTTMTDPSTGGTWSSSNTGIATIGSSSGIMTGVSAGTVTISYTLGACGIVYTTVTVNATPAAITGITSLCAGSVSTLHDATTGGAWSSSNTAVATVGTSGIVSGVSAGLATISYTVSGCSSTTVATIDAPPVITGPGTVCVGNTILLNTNIPGTWTSSNPAVASVVPTGMTTTVSGVTPGTATITCTSISTGCVSTQSVSVTSTCTGTPAAGAAHLSAPANCSGNQDLLYLTSYSTTCGVSYQWQYSVDSVAWGPIAGATNDSAYVHPTTPLYYRCILTCYSSGLSSTSAPTRVSIYNHITSHSVLNTPAYFCNGPDFELGTCGSSHNSNIKTYYGDGTSDTTHLTSFLPDSSANADIFHTYNLPGTYTVKQVLRDGITPQDSITFSTDYSYCRTLPVYFYFDANNNCAFDNGDDFLYHPFSVEVDSNGVPVDTVTVTYGLYYRALGDSGTIYRFKVITHDPGLSLSCPATGIIYDTITNFANTYAPKYIGFNCATSGSFDLGITAHMLCARHEAWGQISVFNTYCTPEAAVVTMNISPKYIFESADPAPYSISGHTVTWHMSPLSAYTSSTPYPNIRFHLTIPGAFLTTGDTVNTTFSVTPTTGDVNLTNNNISRADTIYSSYDPNMMIVSPLGPVIACTPLEYTVKFKNTGNDTARNIAVIDTLPNNVDATSLKLVSASSSVKIATVKFGGRTLVKFDLAGINLPDSSHHNKCEGSVTFSVKTKNGLADGTIISNRASIYFDDNAPIVTNWAQSVIGISPIAGPASVCNGATLVLTDGTPNGIWSASNANANVVSGIVTGISAGLDTIKYTLSNSCTTRFAMQEVTVQPTVAPGVTISTSSATGDTVCDGTAPVFTANTTNGGSTPTFEWQLNGSSSGTDSTFSYSPPINGDVITVKITSNAACVDPDTAVNTIILTVVEPFIPPITLDAYPGIFIEPGTVDTFVATVPAGGPTPTYQWLLNGNPIPGATKDTLILTTINDQDSVTCVATGNDLCKLSTFNSFIITVGYLNVRTLSNKGDINMYPNPNKGEFVIKGTVGTIDEEVNIEVTNMMGQSVYSRKITSRKGMIEEHVKLSDNLSNGMYILNLRTATESRNVHFVIEQ